MNDSGGKTSPDIGRLAAGVVYFLLIGVVIYGMKDHVYDGFGSVVPWLIMALFAVMGVVRVMESFGINVGGTITGTISDDGLEKQDDGGEDAE